MSEIRIPAAALEAGALVIARADEDTSFGEIARAACRAMLTAWPGMYRASYGGDEPPFLILPLPTEKTDDKA